MKKNGYTTIELLIFLGIFSFGYFFGAVKISSEFDVDYELEMYELKIASFEKNAVSYGYSNEDLFAEENEVYITVDDLVKVGFILNKEGVVTDPRDESKNLNEIKIKLTKEKDEIVAKVLV